MNIAIVGSRNAGNINLAQELEKRINIMEGDAIVSGGARGIDTLAASYAKERNLKLIELRPDYAKYGTQLRRICLHRTFRKVGNPILSRSHHRREPPTHQPSFHPARQHQ